MSDELMPCAWCHKPAIEERPHPGCSLVYCSNIDCPVHANTGWCDESEESAASRWNRRASPAPGVTDDGYVTDRMRYAACAAYDADFALHHHHGSAMERALRAAVEAAGK